MFNPYTLDYKGDEILVFTVAQQNGLGFNDLK